MTSKPLPSHDLAEYRPDIGCYAENNNNFCNHYLVEDSHAAHR